MSTHIEKIEHIENAHFHINNTPSNIPDDIKPDFKLLYDSLKERYKKRFESKLDGRFEITLEVNKDWNFNQPQTYKVNYRENTNIDEAFKAIRESFIEKGRLLIVGSPGSGKTVLLLKLALELLGDKCKANQQIPVIFNLASWSPDYAKFDDWLIDVLNTGNGLSKDFARTLLDDKRIIFFLDGLDELSRNEETEIANEKRAKCLDSLNDYLREGRKAVICCRREEFAKMQTATNQDAPVSAKIEVLDLSKDDIELALLFAQENTKSDASATNLLKIIETNDVFLDVLATPFYFTTALEVFDSKILKEKDFPTDKDRIKKYLLDKFIESKIKHTNKLNEFEKDKAKILKWFGWLANLMEKKQLVNFELADLQPTDSSMKSIYITFYLFLRILYVLIFQVSTFFYISMLFSLFSGLNLGIIIGSFITIPIAVGLLVFNIFIAMKASLHTWDIHKTDLSRKNLLINIVINMIFISALYFLLDLYGLLFYVSFLGIDVYKVGRKIAKPLTIIQTPYQRLTKSNFLLIYKSCRRLIEFLILFVLLNFYFDETITSLSYYLNKESVTDTLKFIKDNHLIFLFALGQIIQLPLLPIMKHSYLRLCLYLERSTPLKYVTFLDLAAEARILEKDGGHWRFRHQTLQEHFANMK